MSATFQKVDFADTSINYETKYVIFDTLTEKGYIYKISGNNQQI